MSAAAFLTVSKNGQTVRSQEIAGEVVIGRGEECGLRLDDRAVSREHAVVRAIQGGLQIEKKSEFSPLSVNGVECTKAIIKEGDVVEIGPYRMKLGRPASAAPAKPAAPNAGEMARVIPITGSVSLPLSSPALGQPVNLAPASQSFAPAGTESIPPPSENANSFNLDFGGAENAATPQAQSDASPFNPEPLALPVASDVTGELDAADIAPAPQNSPAINFAPSPEAPAPGNGMLENLPSDPNEEPSIVQDLGMQSLGSLEGTGTRVSAQAINAKIVFAPGLANVEELVVTKPETSIGRGSECDVMLNDTKSSRKHALIIRSGARFILKDLGSANGTFINGARVAEYELSDGDRLQIGDVQFDFRAVHSEFAARESELPSIQSIAALTPPVSSSAPPSGYSPAAMPEQEGTNGGMPMPFGASGTLPNFQARASRGTANIGVGGMDAAPGKNKSILEKFRALPPKRQAIWAVIVAALFYFLVIEEDEPMRTAVPRPQATGVAAAKGAQTFEALSADRKRFVEAQHRIAFGHYKNKEYDKALFELQKIFAIVNDYKDSREIERYAQEGKRRLEALEEEHKKRLDDEKNKAKIAELLDRAHDAMKLKQYAAAKDFYTQILVLDPENIAGKSGQHDLEEMEVKREQDRRANEVRQAVNRSAWNQFNSGMAEYNAGANLKALAIFKETAEMEASDAAIKKRSREMMAKIESRLRDRVQPLLASGKAAESAGDFTKAYHDYLAASKIDPRRAEPFDGMDRIHGVLTDKAKVIYTEGVIAESYSDFATAKKKFEEVKAMTPDDDVYHDRAVHKLYRYKPAGDKIQ